MYFLSKLSLKLKVLIFAILLGKIRKIYKLQLKYVQKLQMVQRPTISHFLAKVVDNKILEGQGRGSIEGLAMPFLPKSTLFTNSEIAMSLI